MHILYLSHYYPPEVNAPANRVSQFARAWVQEGHGATILTGFPNHPMGIIPPTNLNDALAELEYCARAGFKGVSIYRFPSGKGYPTPEDDRFWSAAIEIGMPITSHSTTGTTRFACRSLAGTDLSSN